MEENLNDIICEAIQCDNCIAHCNYPPCNNVKKLTETLIKNGIILPPSKIGDTVYYIGGIHNTLVKSARVDEIYFNGCAFGLGLVSENNVYFDMPANKVYFTKKAAEEARILKR